MRYNCTPVRMAKNNQAKTDSITSCFCCCCSVAQLCLTLCDPMDCSSPGFPVLHRLQKLAQTCVHCVGDAVQPSRPLSSPSPPALNLYEHQVFSSESALHISWPILFINLESESMTRDSPDVWYKIS